MENMNFTIKDLSEKLAELFTEINKFDTVNFDAERYKALATDMYPKVNELIDMYNTYIESKKIIYDDMVKRSAASFELYKIFVDRGLVTPEIEASANDLKNSIAEMASQIDNMKKSFPMDALIKLKEDFSSVI